jgi:hypothetical protein
VARVIYIDVDDTLIRSFGSKRIPMSHTVEVVRQLKADGNELYCWSSGGGAYAKSSAEELGLADCFIGFLPKPQALLDDVLFRDWRVQEVHPNEGSQLLSP